MAARSTATPSAGLKELEAEARMPPTDSYSDVLKPSGLSYREAVEMIVANVKLLVFGPLIVAVATFLIVSILPKSYTSTVYLALDENESRTADARIRSSFVLDKVLAEYNAPRDTLEARRRLLDSNLRIVIAPGEVQKVAKLYRMEYSAADPAVAQKVSNLLINAWLDSTKPPPAKRALIEAEIDRLELQVTSITRLIDQLEKDAPSLLAAQSLQGELATPIFNLISKRDQNIMSLATLKNSLDGVSRDVIFGAPDLPEEPSWPKRGIITVLSAVAAGLLLLIFIFLRRFGTAVRLRQSH